MGCEGSSGKEHILKLFEVHNTSSHLQQAANQRRVSRTMRRRNKGLLSQSTLGSLALLPSASLVCSSLSASRDISSVDLPCYPGDDKHGTNCNSKRRSLKAVSTMLFLVFLTSCLVLDCSASTSSNYHNHNLYRRPSSSSANQNNYYSRVTRESSANSNNNQNQQQQPFNIIPGYDSIVAAAAAERDNNLIGDSNSNVHGGGDSSSLSRPGSSLNTFPPHPHQYRHHRHHPHPNQYSGLHPNSLQTAPVGG